jgi:hypothetical protein
VHRYQNRLLDFISSFRGILTTVESCILIYKGFLTAGNALLPNITPKQ